MTSAAKWRPSLQDENLKIDSSTSDTDIWIMSSSKFHVSNLCLLIEIAFALASLHTVHFLPLSLSHSHTHIYTYIYYSSHIYLLIFSFLSVTLSLSLSLTLSLLSHSQIFLLSHTLSFCHTLIPSLFIPLNISHSYFDHSHT